MLTGVYRNRHQQGGPVPVGARHTPATDVAVWGRPFRAVADRRELVTCIAIDVRVRLSWDLRTTGSAARS
ncbi:hypothetical protein GCM10010124_24010 [Pilimelia terevasa]|uniref:Uncharacterized protein n=1 Tax=Pilimelia terevasa TaxID=53372 RepID=A0A8J3BLT2_9ACTN|nr:hypothetical protein GCM10010124_24010 [Pilimelia terevasa]